MRILTLTFLLVCCTVARAANPSFQSFDSTQFDAQPTPAHVAIKDGVKMTNVNTYALLNANQVFAFGDSNLQVDVTTGTNQIPVFTSSSVDLNSNVGSGALLELFEGGHANQWLVLVSTNGTATIKNGSLTATGTGTVHNLGNADVNLNAGDATVYFWKPEFAAWVQTSSVFGTNGTGAGITINPTDGYVPYRSSATTFGNSPLERVAPTTLYIHNESGGQTLIPFNISGSHNISLTGDWIQFSSNSVAGINLYPTAADGTTPFTLNSLSAHATGNLFELKNDGTLAFPIAAASGYTGTGTKVFSDDGTFHTTGMGSLSNNRYPRSNGSILVDGAIFEVNSANQLGTAFDDAALPDSIAVEESIVNLAADNETISQAKGRLVLSSDTNTATDRTFHISNGRQGTGKNNGMELLLLWSGNNAGELPSGDSNMALSQTWLPTNDGEMLNLLWDKTNGRWREQWRYPSIVGDNWTASGTTNSTLPGVASVNRLVATNSVSAGAAGTAGIVTVYDTDASNSASFSANPTTTTDVNLQMPAAPFNGLAKMTITSVTNMTPSAAVAGTDYVAPQTTFTGYGISTTSANLASALTDETGSGVAVFGTSPTFTTSLTLNAAANTTPITSSGYSLTGSAANSFIDLNGTWNTSGNPTAIKLVMTNTASGGSAKFLEFFGGTSGVTSELSVRKDGYIVTPFGIDIPNLYHAGGVVFSIGTVGGVSEGVNIVNNAAAKWFISDGAKTLAADGSNATATMANTGLSVTVVTGRKYTFRLILYVNDSVAAEGVKIDFDGGTATATNFRAHATVFDTALNLSAQVSALATDIASSTVTGDAMVEVHGSFEPSSSGTFIPRYSQNTHVTGTVTIYRGSNITMVDAQ